MIKLLRNMAIIIASAAALVYLFFFAVLWNLEPLRHSVEIVVWNVGKPVTVTVYPALVVVGAAVLATVVALLVGFLPPWLAHGRVGRGARRDQGAIAQLESGLDSIARKDLAAARRALHHGRKHDVTQTASRLALADLHLRDGHHAQALELLEEERAANPASVRVSLAKARVLEADGRPAEAATELRRALREVGPSIGLVEALRDLLQREQSWEEAYATQQHLVRLLREARSPALEGEAERLTSLRYEVARLRLDQGKTEDAIAALRDIVKRSPRFVPAAVTLGDAYVARGQDAEALKVWEKTFKSESQLVLLDRLEELALKQGDPSRMLRVYQESIQRDPKNMVVRFMYGKYCLKLEMVEEALEQFDQLEANGVHLVELAVLRGEAHHRRNHLDAAVQEFRKAAHMDGMRYVCRSCGARSPRWEARCHDCQKWDTVRSAARVEIEGQARPAVVGPLPTV